MNELGKILVIAGLAIAGVGALVWSGFGRGWFGRLPGDLNYSRESFSFHFPLVTCLLISVVLTLLLWLFRR
jgi:membrane protein implicated in regulation of membrane protease activity